MHRTARLDAIKDLLDQQERVVMALPDSPESDPALAEIARARGAVAQRRKTLPKGGAVRFFFDALTVATGGEPEDREYEMSRAGQDIATGIGLPTCILLLPVGVFRLMMAER
jgi:hypothetical protein